jgi:uncharacterized membrane protein YdbT with pleckstrin-like domain
MSRHPGRVRDALASAFAEPAEIVRRHLAPGEQVLYMDAPAFDAFVVDELPMLLLAVAAGGGVTIWAARAGHPTMAALAMVAGVAIVLYLVAKRWAQRYTAYVLTTMRVMRVSGFLHRSTAWIPWMKVTDIRYEASLMGRILGYATVYIESANEKSGLAEMRNLQNPAEFYAKLTDLVQRKHGSISYAGALDD